MSGLIPSVEEVRALIEKHQLKRPDPLVCKHPQATKSQYGSWVKWCREHEQLQSLLELATRAAENVWRDVATGQPVTNPINWTSGAASFTNLKSGQPPRNKGKHGPGRPRCECPSKETLQRREQRERKNEERTLNAR